MLHFSYPSGLTIILIKIFSILLSPLNDNEAISVSFGGKKEQAYFTQATSLNLFVLVMILNCCIYCDSVYDGVCGNKVRLLLHSMQLLILYNPNSCIIYDYIFALAKCFIRLTKKKQTGKLGSFKMIVRPKGQKNGSILPKPPIAVDSSATVLDCIFLPCPPHIMPPSQLYVYGSPCPPVG